VTPDGSSGPLRTMPIDRFLDLLASPSPTPGGGGVAALAGALSAGLISMVSHLTIGKPKYAAVEEEAKKLLAQAEELRQSLHRLIDADAEAYNGVMAAYRLPKNTEEEKRVRSARIQEASIEASRVPLQTAKECMRVLDLSLPAARITNSQALGDVAMAAYLAQGAIKGLVDNIDINLRPLKGQAAAEELMAEARALTQGLQEKVDAIIREAMARV